MLRNHLLFKEAYSVNSKQIFSTASRVRNKTFNIIFIKETVAE